MNIFSASYKQFPIQGLRQIKGINRSLEVYYDRVATMMSCPLPLPLSILPSTLHGDFPPVHIGVKQMQLIQASSLQPHQIHSFMQQNQQLQLQHQQQQQLPQQHIHHYHQQFQQQQNQMQQLHQQQLQMLHAYMQLQLSNSNVTNSSTKFNGYYSNQQQHQQQQHQHLQLHQQQQQHYTLASGGATTCSPLAIIPASSLLSSAATALATQQSAATAAFNNVNKIISFSSTTATSSAAATAVTTGDVDDCKKPDNCFDFYNLFSDNVVSSKKTKNLIMKMPIATPATAAANTSADYSDNNVGIAAADVGGCNSNNNNSNKNVSGDENCSYSRSCVSGSSNTFGSTAAPGSYYSSASSDCSMSSSSSLLHFSSSRKRGSDELLSQAAVMAPASDNNNQDLATKKAKLDSGTVLGGVGKPSKVIHLRNIPNESGEPDVISLGVPFGRVTNVLVLKGKNQAFLEMADEVSATSMVTCYTHNPPQMRGRMVYVQFSNHRELKTDQTHTVGSTTVAIPNQDYKIDSPSSGSPLPVCRTATENALAVLNSAGVTTVVSHSSSNGGGPNTVLRVIVESLLYPVSLDILHQIFQRFGKVLKIVTFTKNNSFQALIQYPNAESAQHARAILDGQNIYNGCCTLRIDNSKLTALNVKYNNDKSRDFTNPSLPPGEPGADIIPSAGGLVNANDLLLIAARQRPITGDKIVNGLGATGVLPPFALGIGTPLSGGYSSGIPNLGAFALANSGAIQSAAPAMRGFSNVLLVSNLNEEMVTPDALFTLFGVYGDVQRVKILYNKKDSALIQMAEPQQSYLAMTHLDKLRLWGKSIRVMASKHQAVQLPKEGQPDAGLTRDYSQNPLHRFKKPGSKNYQNIYPPSATLHLSNIPSSCSEEDIKEAFAANNFEVKAFKFFPKDRKMALLQLSSVEEAVLALIKMHNHQLSESNHLRVSFSKSNI